MKKQYIPDTQCNYLSLLDAVAFFNLSASTIKKLARESGAKLKIGSSARYRKDVLTAYIESMQTGKEA